MSIYNKNGNVIGGGEITDESIKQAFINAIANGTINAGVVIGATLTYTGISNAWIENATAAYNLMLDAYKYKPSVAIPFFISTDQHGNGLQQHRWVNNIDKDGLELININLGDTVQDVYGETTIQNLYGTIKQVKNYVGVVGNHECKHGADRFVELTLQKTYGTTNLRREMNPDKSDCYLVEDGLHNVKWLVLEDYYINSDGTNYTHGFGEKTLDWIIDVLSRNDGMDVIILMHWPCYRTARYRSHENESANADRWDGDTFLLWDFFVARKNKSSGTYKDVNGTAHAYDFSQCKTDLLCTLHGHTHSEWMSTDYGLTAYAANRYYPGGNGGKCVFGLVDRADKKLRIWEFSANGLSDPLALDI